MDFTLQYHEFKPFQLRLVVFLIIFEAQDHTVPHWKALRCPKYEARGLSVSALKSISLLGDLKFEEPHPI